jgi:hypothetical protein
MHQKLSITFACIQRQTLRAAALITVVGLLKSRSHGGASRIQPLRMALLARTMKALAKLGGGRDN